MPIDVVGLAGVIMGSLIVLIPVAGLTARFAMKPIVESMAKLKQSSNQGETVNMLERRITLLEKEVQNLSGIRDDLGRLIEEMEFQRQLTSRSGRDQTQE
ncbi:MAG: hypothetical protein PVH00_10210 [Gemmatimonadota bacterium]|jgi:hypothetical protein